MTAPGAGPGSTRPWDRATLTDVVVGELAAVLGVDRTEIDPAKPFDSYGLDSIDAVITTGVISDRLGFELAPEFLLLHRTIDEVVEQLVASGPGPIADTPAAGGSKHPVFLFPAAGARGKAVSRLAQEGELALDCRIMEAGSWRDWLAGDDDLDALGRRAADAIVAQQPTGPLRLAGYSQGGQLALATAVSLSARGYRVETLVLLDSPARTPLRPSERLRTARRGLRVARDVGKSMARRLHRAEATDRESGAARGRTALYLYRRLRGSRAGRALLAPLVTAIERTGSDRLRLRLETHLQMEAFADMWRTWSSDWPRPVSVQRVVLLRSDDPGPEDRGWRDFFPSLEVVRIEGHHTSIFDREYLPDLSRKFERVIEESGKR